MREWSFVLAGWTVQLLQTPTVFAAMMGLLYIQWKVIRLAK